MSLINYPPIIEGKLPAFVVDSINNSQVKINVPYVLNRAVSTNDFTHMAIMLKTVTTGTIKLNYATGECKMQNLNSKQRYATFTFNKDADGNDSSLDTFTPSAGIYYKVQIAFQDGANQSPWSNVGVIKCTAIPELTISSLTEGIDNLNPQTYEGTYKNSDVTEKVYSYKYTIYDENDAVYETSGDIIHNGSLDQNDVGVGVISTLTWKPFKSLPENKRYRITLSIRTINDYIQTTAAYYIKASATVDANIPARLLANPDYDNGRVQLSLIKREKDATEQAFTGQFVISRYSSNTNSWNEVCKFNMLSQTPSDAGILWTDYTIEHGASYLYSLQAYNDNGLYSNRMYHVLKNPDTFSSKPYLDFDEFGEPYPIIGDFEDMFLTDGERQLKIRFNPKVSSFKPTILESKVETIGSKYPFIFRNGNVNYKEFPITGLLSYLGDEKELFMSGVFSPEVTMTRSHTSAAAGALSRKDWLTAPSAGSKLTSDNFYRERQFKMTALDWLTNGKPKLFRSPSEGNCIVRLMNTSLSPEEALGRMLHTFSSTAYEIDECTFENLAKYNLLCLPNIDNRTMKFQTVNLHEVSESGVFAPGYAMYHIRITDAPPDTTYNLAFNDIIGDGSVVSVTIGPTGSFIPDVDIYPLSSITLVNGDEYHQAQLHYGYYDTTIPDNFSYISQITTKDQVSQIIGYNDKINVIEDKLEDIRQQVCRLYSVIINPRPIYTIYRHTNGQYYWHSTVENDATLITEWSDVAIYYIEADKKYYSGNPNKNYVILTVGSTGKTMPDRYFKFNNEYILDLSTGNAYHSEELHGAGDVLQPNPAAAEKFIMLTNGRYQIKGDLGQIRSMYLSTGVYVDLAYELKEILYSVEETDDEVKSKKYIWQNNPNETNYQNYLNALEAAIAAADTEDGYYVL